MDWAGNAGLWWLIAAVLLAITELAVPGVFLVFLALAAGITGVLALLFPDLSLGGQLIGFAAWSAVTLAIGRRWYRDYPVATSDPLLNAPLARLIGQQVTVTRAIEGGEGRVRVGDGEWSAHGPDAPAGARVTVTGAQDGVLLVAPAAALSGATDQTPETS